MLNSIGRASDDGDNDDDDEYLVLEQERRRLLGMSLLSHDDHHQHSVKGSLRDYLRTEFCNADLITPQRLPVGQYLRAVGWCLLLLSGWAVTRLTCSYGIPNDCNLANHSLEIMADIQVMLTYGVLQAWLCEVLVERRFVHLVAKRRLWYFFLSFFLSGISFSAISDIPGFGSSLSSGESYSTAQVILYIVLVGFAAIVLCWHYYHAWQCYIGHRTHRVYFYSYAISRTAILAYVLSYVSLVIVTADKYEFHHYFVAWAASLFAQFENGVSIIWLGITAGIFTQGIGAYRTNFLFWEQD